MTHRGCFGTSDGHGSTPWETKWKGETAAAQRDTAALAIRLLREGPPLEIHIIDTQDLLGDLIANKQALSC